MASPRPPRDLPPPDPPNPTDAHIQIKHQPATQNDITQDECFVRNSSFLSRDIEAQKVRLEKSSPPKNVPPPRKSSLLKENSKDGGTSSNSPSVKTLSPPDVKVASPPKKEVVNKINHLPSVRNEVKQIQKSEVTSPPVSQVTSPPVSKVTSPPVSKVTSPPVSKVSSPPVSKVSSPPVSNVASSPVSKVLSPPVSKVSSSPVSKVSSPPVSNVASPPLKNIISPPPNRDSSHSTIREVVSPPFNKGVTSPPINSFKFNRTDSKSDENIIANKKKDTILAKEAPIKSEKLSLITTTNEITDKEIECNSNTNTNNTNNKPADVENGDKTVKITESNGVGDKIRKFEKAAEDASVNAGKLSRPGSVRGRSRTDRLGSDSKDDLPPPATPFKDHVFFDLGNTDKSTTESQVSNNAEPQEKIVTKGLVNSAALKWQRNEATEEKIQKPEPQKIIKPEFKPMPSPIDVTIRSPSLGCKLPDQFPSHGTAFRNVASPDTARPVHKFNEDINTQNYKCKPKNKEKYSVSKGSSYFTRGSEEIWLVKKKDIEEIEERVLDSFRRAGGNMCMRSESMRPSSDSGQSTAFTHATMGRTKRQMYGRSESLDPQWAGTRAQTLKRQSSVACTCGHDKKTRAKSVETTPRPRSRSHGDDNNQAHVLDKYETLV